MGLAADFVLIVVAGLAGGILARALGLPLLVGYVAAGIVVGPHTAGPTVAQIHDIETLAEIGVALLLFSIGLEVSFRDLNTVRRMALFGAPLQILLTIAAAAAASITLLHVPWTEALWIGAMVSVSSTMVVLKVIAERGYSTTLASRVMIGILLVQDLAVIPMLIILPQLNRPEDLARRVGLSLLLAAAMIAGVYFAGTRLLPPIFRRILAWGSRELFLIAVVATGVGIGAAMHAAGLSFALGAFVAGLVLSESEFSHQALSDVSPLRDVFGLLFFVSVGMLFDPAYALGHAALIGAAVVAVLVGKAALTGWLSRAFGYRFLAPWIIGLGLSQIGEFSFVLARAGISSEMISKNTYDLMLTVTVLTMAVAPLVSAAATPLGRAWRRLAPGGERQAPPPVDLATHEPLQGHAVIAGYGRTGRVVARALRDAGVPCVIVESSYPLLADLRDDGFAGLWGDISSEDILRAAQLPRAGVLILTMPDAGTVHLALERSRHLAPSVRVIARSPHVQTVRELTAAGVATVQPEFEGGLEIVRLALLQCGRADGSLAPVLARLRQEMYQPSSEA